MEIIYSGFDTIVFAVQGALSAQAIERMEHVKDSAEKDQVDVQYPLEGSNKGALLSPNGRKGGYAFIISTGPTGQNIAIKNNLARSEWNAHVKLRSLGLATLGWEEAVEDALSTLKALEFHVTGISLNRVDYCMDFLNTPITLDPRDFVAHSRVKKTAHCEELADEDGQASTCNTSKNRSKEVTAIMRSEVFEGITIGKMPGRQVIVYDKRREVIDKRSFMWFKIWGIDRLDVTQHVHRIELRAGKDELMKYDIRAFDDFKTKIGDVFVKATESVRMIDPQSTDTNISRKAVHPTWKHVQEHVKTQLFEYVSNCTPSDVLHVIRETKTSEYWAQIRGNIAGYAVCRDVKFEDIARVIPDLIRAELELATNNPDHPFRKSYVKARDRLKFI